MPIPKLIHQTTRSRRLMTQPFIANLEKMRSLNPGWEISVFQDEDCYEYIRMYYDEDMLRSYCAINPKYGAARADLFRYLLMYERGGVYLDIKSSATVPLDETFQADDHYILSHWDNARGRPFEGWGVHAETPYPGEFQQWHIIAAPRHPFLEQVIARVQRNIHQYDPVKHGTGKRAVLRMTGPIAYTHAVRTVLGHAPSRLVNIAELGFVYSFLDPSNDVFRQNGRLAHEALMPGHYRNLTEPLVLS